MIEDDIDTSFHILNHTFSRVLVLLMGLSVDRWGWIRQRASLSRRFRCIAIDNRGSGLSDKPHGDYDIFTMVEDAVAVCIEERSAAVDQTILASAAARDCLRWRVVVVDRADAVTVGHDAE